MSRQQSRQVVSFSELLTPGRIIGIDRATGLPTSIYTIITDAAGNVITMFPGRPDLQRNWRTFMIRVCKVQDEKGNEFGEAVDVASDLLAHPGDPCFSCLRFVDPYGDTVFNRMQLVGSFWRTSVWLEGTDYGTQHTAAIDKVESLIELCQAEPHSYLKLIGD